MALRHFFKHLTILTSSYGFCTLSGRFIHPSLTSLFNNIYPKTQPLIPTKFSLPLSHCYTSLSHPSPSTLLSPYLSVRIRCPKDIAVSFNYMIQILGFVLWIERKCKFNPRPLPFFFLLLGLFRMCFLKLLCALVQLQLLWMKMIIVTLLMRLTLSFCCCCFGIVFKVIVQEEMGEKSL